MLRRRPAGFSVVGLVGALACSPQEPRPCASDDAHCDSSRSKSVGSLGLNLEISGGILVEAVDYILVGDSIAPLQGTIPVRELGSRVSARIGALPEGADYEATLTAENEQVNCSGSASFDILAGETTEVVIVLDCRSRRDDGSVIIDGDFNLCPVITSLIALPLQVRLGGEVELTSRARDGNDDSLEFLWVATAGEFDDPTEASTRYRCTSEGSQQLTLTVTDGRCEDEAELTVECVDLCGNGDLEAGEECDDDNRTPGDGCDELCRVEICGNGRIDVGEECDDNNNLPADGCDDLCRVEICGNGRIDAGEECDDNNNLPADGCDDLCRVEICGNGRIDAGEECDDNNNLPADGCDDLCRVEACGNGRIDAGEECDDNNNLPADGCDDLCRIEACGNGRIDAGEQCDDGNLERHDGCDDECQIEISCEECLATQCTDRLVQCDTTSCERVLACARDTQCAASGAVTDCYCGAGVPITTCVGMTVPGGVCRAPIEQGTGALFPSLVLERIIDPTYPSGDAFQLLLCEQQFCSESCSSNGE